VLAFTSGTAGMPKAAMLSHGNLASNIAQASTTPIHIQASDVVYGVLPLHHIFGLNVVLGIALTVGASVVLVQRFDPATALDTIHERGVTVIPGAPPMWVAWSHFDDLPKTSFSKIRMALSGASKMPEEVLQRLHARFGLDVARGIRPHGSLACRHQRGRTRVEAGLDRQGGGRRRSATRRRVGRRHRQRRLWRDLGQGTERVQGLPRRPRSNVQSTDAGRMAAHR
jgi:acyl-CoA synthetase (AMP-forming)/AMP-acid ligase II